MPHKARYDSLSIIFVVAYHGIVIAPAVLLLFVDI